MRPPPEFRHSMLRIARAPPVSGRVAVCQPEPVAVHCSPGAVSKLCQKPETAHVPVLGPETRAAFAPWVAPDEEPTIPNWFQPPNTAPPEPGISKLGLARMHCPETSRPAATARRKTRRPASLEPLLISLRSIHQGQVRGPAARRRVHHATVDAGGGAAAGRRGPVPGDGMRTGR